MRYALQSGMDEGQVARLTGWDPWFVAQLASILNLEGRLRAFDLASVPPRLLREAKRMGFSDEQLAHILGVRGQGSEPDLPSPVLTNGRGGRGVRARIRS